MKYLKNFNYIYLFLVVAGLVSMGLYIKTTDLMRETIGIRDQAKLTKEQALFVAKCQANHRDVSLNF